MPALQENITRDPSIEGFITRQKISRSYFYLLKSQNKAPRMYYIGRLGRISAEAEAAWVAEREAQQAAAEEASVRDTVAA
jgi:hypothetical protein